MLRCQNQNIAGCQMSWVQYLLGATDGLSSAMNGQQRTNIGSKGQSPAVCIAHSIGLGKVIYKRSGPWP